MNLHLNDSSIILPSSRVQVYQSAIKKLSEEVKAAHVTINGCKLEGQKQRSQFQVTDVFTLKFVGCDRCVELWTTNTCAAHFCLLTNCLTRLEKGIKAVYFNGGIITFGGDILPATFLQVKFRDLYRRMVQQERTITEQSRKIAAQDRKNDEMNRKLLEYDQKIGDLMARFVRNDTGEVELEDEAISSQNLTSRSVAVIEPLVQTVGGSTAAHVIPDCSGLDFSDSGYSSSWASSITSINEENEELQPIMIKTTSTESQKQDCSIEMPSLDEKGTEERIETEKTVHAHNINVAVIRKRSSTDTNESCCSKRQRK